MYGKVIKEIVIETFYFNFLIMIYNKWEENVAAIIIMFYTRKVLCKAVVTAFNFTPDI